MATKKELKEVINLIRKKFPKCADYNFANDRAEILDRNDKVIGYLSEDELTRIWNGIELS